MILTITAAYDVWTSDLYQKNEALIYSFGMIVILLLVIMIIISISKSKRLKTLQRINEVAEESNQLKNAFIANMTHEIRTPLNAIVGFTTMLAEMDNLDRETRMAFLKEINDNKDSLLQLVNDLLDYSKIEANTLEYNDGEVDVNALIDEVCTTENMRSHPTGIQVEFVERLPQCRLVVDRVRFAQVIGPEIEVLPGYFDMIMMFGYVCYTLRRQFRNTFFMKNNLFQFLVNILFIRQDIDNGAKLRFI